MKKALLSLALTASLCFGLFANTIVEAQTLDSNKSKQTEKIPDAFNANLEKQKLQEYKKTNSDGVKVSPNKPVVLKFSDGSSITYSVEVTPTSKVKTESLAASGYKYNFKKNYSWGIHAHAAITVVVDNVTKDNRHFKISGDKDDVWQEHSSVFASVTYSSQKADTKRVGGSTFLTAEGKGTIKYDIPGIGGTREESYTIRGEVDPADPWNIIMH
ncbi:hypothetical protein [Brevibacillus borstelensis]|uniref:hypothetical protein n=1 Tax=Brevibacillus borstelensis TaxID=45462 RepID=UPI0030BD5B45